MKCSDCGTDTVIAPQGRAFRCLTCGKLLDAAPRGEQTPPGAAPSRHSYKTPFGKLLAQVQKSGNWVAVSYISVPDARKTTAATLIGNLLTSWRELEHPSLAKLHSFDEKELRCTWALPEVAGAAPLCASAPLRPAEIEALIRTLAGQLGRLHRAGLGAFDLSPSVVFVSPDAGRASFVPAPWLASQALWSPGKVKDMPFVAPELDQSQEIYPDPVRADLYAMGALAWFLLTGGDRRTSPAKQPSEHSPELASWDQFIDGCCRSNPARRFDSVAAALKVLDEGRPSQRERLVSRGPSAGSITASQKPVPGGRQANTTASTPTESKAIPPKSRRRLVWVTGMVVVAILALGVYLRRDQVASVFPSMGGVLVPYQRGFGDTILKYEDRSYEGAKWVRLKESKALAQLTSIDERSASLVELHKVIGWDEQNFWVSAGIPAGDDDAGIFRQKNGHWSVSARLKRGRSEHVLRLLGEDTVLFTGQWSSVGHLWEISPRGIADLQELDTSFHRHFTEAAAIAPDLYFFFGGPMAVAKVADGKLTSMRPDQYKEVYLHSTDNTPNKEYYAGNLHHARSPKQGEAFAVFWKGSWANACKLGHFRSGIWYEVGDLPGETINDVWVGGTAPDYFFVLVGPRSWVHLHELGGRKLDLPLATPQENTSGNLIKVWGTSPDKFWVMDDNGTIWEKRGNESRVVVRGVHREDVKFRDAWVSPKGTVIAVTEKHVYRLD